MRFDPLFLLMAILVLWTPGHLFYTAAMRERVRSVHGSNGLPVGRLLLTWQNWLDGVRGFCGAYLLYEHTFPLERMLGDYSYFWELGALGFVLLAGICFQVLYYQIRCHLYALAPVFFLIGISFAMVDWWIVLFGMVPGLIFGRIINFSEAFFAIMAVVIGIFGYVFHGIDFEVYLICTLLVVPIIVSFLINENLVVAHR